MLDTLTNHHPLVPRTRNSGRGPRPLVHPNHRGVADGCERLRAKRAAERSEAWRSPPRTPARREPRASRSSRSRSRRTTRRRERASTRTREGLVPADVAHPARPRAADRRLALVRGAELAHRGRADLGTRADAGRGGARRRSQGSDRLAALSPRRAAADRRQLPGGALRDRARRPRRARARLRLSLRSDHGARQPVRRVRPAHPDLRAPVDALVLLLRPRPVRASSSRAPTPTSARSRCSSRSRR